MSRIESLETRQLLSVAVDTLVDVSDANDGRTSLREAIAAAPANGNEVEFHASLHGGTIELSSQLTISQSITITGPGAEKLTIDAQGNSRAFYVQSTVGMATISGLTITGGFASQHGGAIFNEGSLKLQNTAIVGNRAAIHGGGVFTSGPSLEIDGSTIENNRGSWGGGVLGVLAGDERIYITNSTIANNVADDPATSNGQGGGVRVNVTSPSTVTNLGIHNSTISDNRAEAQGGGVHITGQARANLRNVTIVKNRADGYAGGVYNEAVNANSESIPLLMRNTILAANTAGDAARADGLGSFAGQFGITSRYNIVGVDHASFQLFTTNVNQLGSAANPLNPRLSPLTNVGGLTRVHLPLPGSTAIDRGADGDAAGLTGDQRGSGRFVEDNTAPNAPGNTSDVGSVEFDARVAVGDFNGDGREDELRYSPVLKSLLVAEKAATSAGWEVGAWGSLALATTPSPTSTNGIIVGDFSGDGRDDVMIQDLQGYTWLLGISDGTLFHFTQLKNNGNLLSAGWQYVYVGDFDADGDEEIIGKVNGGSNWVLVEYNSATGLSKTTTVGLSGFTPGTQVFVQDVNRDGRDDFITRTNSSSPWMVNVSAGASAGTLLFANAVEMSAWIGYGYNNATGELNADKAIAKVIEEFAWVYNNVELELYPGLMKGPTATAQTKAGNNWDQAALLEQRLQASGAFSAGHVKIASGKVRVEAAQFDALANWLGVKTANAAFTALKFLDFNAVALDANGGDVATTKLPAVAIEFTHAWVQARVPTPAGFAWGNLDPSWKFKDRQNGIPLSSELDSVHTNLSTGIFDEFSYLALDPTKDRSLPVEFFADQAMNWLTANHPGASLADLAYDGPILTKEFSELPTGLSSTTTLVTPLNLATYESFEAIVADPVKAAQLTHRVLLGLERKITSTTWANEWATSTNPSLKYQIVVPRDGQKSFQITYSPTQNTRTNANTIATLGASQFWSRLIVDGVQTDIPGGDVDYASQSALTSSNSVRVTVEHLAPSALSSATSNRIFQYPRDPGKVIALNLDANQHSHESIAALQAQVLAATAGGAPDIEDSLRPAIDDLASYTGAKYWYDFNRNNQTISRLTQTVGGQFSVGSGLVTADPELLTVNGSYLVDYLPYGIAPENFGIDLPNGVQSLFSINTGETEQEALHLAIFNGSALEHNIVEETIAADSISTVKGLQRAYRRNLGVGAAVSGNPTPSKSDDVIYVFESRQVGEVRKVYHLYTVRSVGSGSDVQIIGTNDVGSELSELQFKDLLVSHEHATQIDDSLWDTLSNKEVNGVGPLDGVEEPVRTWTTKHRTKVDSWTGAVYFTNIPNHSMQFAIQADGGAATNGGYSGGVTTAPPPELPSGSFPYATYAGDPVHTSNGNMFRDETDIVFPNIGVPLTFSRHYDSQSKDDVGMGVGWTYSFSDVLYLDAMESGTADDEIVWITAGGARHRFKNLSNGVFTSPPELQGKLVRYTAAQESLGIGFRYFDDSGMEYHFQEMDPTANAHPANGFHGPHALLGRLRIQQDSRGNGVQVDYVVAPVGQPPIGRAMTVVRDLHTADRRLVFGYETVDRISSITKYDAGAAVGMWTYSYADISNVVDSEKRLRTATSPNVPVINDSYVESTTTTTVAYDYYGLTPGDPAYAKGMIKNITEADGSWHAYEYYRNGRVFRVKQGELGQSPATVGVDVQTFNYNLFKNSTEFTDERGNIETYIHQANGLQIKQIHADRSQTKSEWGMHDPVTKILIDGTEFLMTSTTDERGAVEKFTYYTDANFKKGQLKTSTAKSYSPTTAIVTEYNYFQPANRPHIVALSTTVVDPGAPEAGFQNLKTTHIYDAEGRLASTTLPNGHDASGAPLPDYATTRTYYTAADEGSAYRLGLLKSIKQPAILDLVGNPVAYETLLNYDAAGNVTSSRTQTAVIAPAVPVIVSESTFAYDSSGNVIRSTDPTGIVKESEYDVLGRLRETGYADTIDPLGVLTSRFKYDKSGRIRESIDPLGRVTRFEYDRQGNVLKQINPDGTEILHEYDPFGNRVATTDALKRTTRFVYDSRKRLIQTILPAGAVERVRYDGVGAVAASIDALGAATTFKYDAAGRLRETKLPDPLNPTGTANPTTTNKYDKLGNLIETIDPEANVTQFKHDKLGRVIQTQTLKGVSNPNRTNSNLTSVSTLVSLTTIDYDAVGNVIETAAYDVSQYLAAATATLLANPRAEQDLAPTKVQVVSTRYNAFGLPLKTINADTTSTRTVYNEAGRALFQFDEAGSVTQFVYDSFGRLQKTLLPDPTTGVITSSSPTTTYQYDAVGNRIAVTDARGFTTRLEYDLFNRPIAATNPLGGRTRSLYDVAGQLVATVNELGQSDYAKFDKQGRAVLKLSADPDGAGPQLPSATRLVYNDAHLIETIDPLGHSTTYEYDRLGRLLNETSVASVDPVVVLATSQYGYDANGNLTTVTDPLNRVTTYLYDELNRRTKTTEPAPGTNGPNGALLLNPQTTTNYDGYGNVKSVVEHRGGSTSQRTTRYQYDARNRQTEDIFDAGIDGTSGVNYLNQRTTFVYDDVGNLEFKREYAENAAAPTGFDLLRTTEYKYDKLGRRIRETLNSNDNASPAPTEQITLTTYDALGNVQTQTENAEVGSGVAALTTTYVYDALNRVLRETTAGSSQTRTTRNKYDAAGNLLSVVDPLGRLSRSEYDRLGRLVKSIAPDPDGDDPLAAETTSFTYDAAGNLRTETNGAAETKRYAYDPQGRLIESIDGRNDKTTRRYDKVGNLIELIDPALNATTYVYDSLDRLQFETRSSVSREWVYDARGDVAITVDRNGRAIRYAYDRDGQMKQSWDYATRADAAASNNNYVAFVNVYYDGLRRLAEQASTQRVAYGNWTTAYRVTDSYVLDGLDRVVQRSNQSQYPATPAHSTGVPAIETTYAYAYEASGQVVTRNQFIAGQFAAETRSTYNAFGELVRQEDKETSSASVPSAILDFESTDAVFSYLGDGSLASTTRFTDWDGSLPNGAGHRNRVRTDYAYDGAGRLKNIAHSQARRSTASWPANTPLVDFDYGYDDAGRIDEIETNWNSTLTGITTRADETKLFDYDDAGQLTVAGYEGFSYGPNGNRTSAWEGIVGANVYETGENNQVEQDTYFTYQYDDEGNLTRRSGAPDVDYETYAWDHRNRLAKVEIVVNGTLTKTIAYRYNASGELVYRSVTPAGQSPQVEHYVVESGQRIMAFETDGDVKRRYQYGPTSDVLFEQVFDHTVTTLLQSETDLLVPLGDHQHTPRAVLAHAGDDSTYVRQSFDVSPFGREDTPWGANGLPDYTGRVVTHGFQGMVYDVDARLYRTAARVYDPHLGRFISEDPIQDGANWYMFAGNDPVNFADPSGLAMQGHPLAGGYSGNVTTKSTIGTGSITANNLGLGPALSSSTNNFIKGAVSQALIPSSFPSTTFGGFVNASLGNSILSGGFGPSPASVGSIASYQTAAHNSYASSLSGTTFPSLTIGDFTYANSLSGLTRIVDPLTSLVQQQRATDAYRADQALSALRGANAAELADIAQRNAVRNSIREYEHGVGQVFLGYGDSISGTAEGIYNVARHPFNTIVGVATAIRHPILTGQAIIADISQKSGSLRGQGAIVGDVLTSIATGGAVKAVKEAGLIGKVAGKLPHVPNNGARLLPGEGAVGTYDDLIRAGTKGDNITPHHIPSTTHMKQHGVSKGDGIAINMEHPHPGSGGRHRQTFTYGTNADAALSPRDALGRGVRDTKRIYEEAGLYGPDIRRALQDLIQRNKAANPGLFD